jgi:hypothetical protein
MDFNFSKAPGSTYEQTAILPTPRRSEAPSLRTTQCAGRRRSFQPQRSIWRDELLRQESEDHARLTINLGLRYDRTFLPRMEENTIGQHGGIETRGRSEPGRLRSPSSRRLARTRARSMYSGGKLPTM